MGNKTYMAKTGEIDSKWWLVDANEKILGRLSSEIAVMLMGKHRPTYTPHIDTGDHVVVVNAVGGRQAPTTTWMAEAEPDSAPPSCRNGEPL